MNPRPGEVWSFLSPTAPAGKLNWKHHLCIGEDGLFLFVSSHRIRRQDHRGVLIIHNDEVKFLPPTKTGRSEISCTTIIARSVPDRTVPAKNRKGAVRKKLMRKLLSHVRASPHLTEDERDAIVEILYAYYGTDLG